jgi:tRNA dimethylallyltransferase
LNDPKGLSRTAAQAVGYKEIIQYLRGEVSLDEALANAVIHSRRLARRQRSWFNRDPRIIWCDNEEEATAILHNVFDNDFPVRN